MAILRNGVWQQTFSLTVPPSSSRMAVLKVGHTGYLFSGRVLTDLTPDGALTLQMYSRWPCNLDLGGQEDNCAAGADPDELFELFINAGMDSIGGVIDLNYAKDSGGATAHRNVLIPFRNFDVDSSRQVNLYAVLTNNDGVTTQTVRGRLSGAVGDISLQ